MMSGNRVIADTEGVTPCFHYPIASQHRGGGRGRVARCCARKLLGRKARRESAGEGMVRCGWDGGAGARRNALLRDGSAWGRQRVRAVWEREAGVVHDSARGEVDDGMRCWGAGDRVIFGWDVHLGSVSDERRRRVGRDARSVVPYPGWCGQTCTRGRGQSVSETRVGSVGSLGPGGAGRAGSAVRASLRAYDGATRSTERAWALRAARRPCLSVIPKKGLNTSLPRATSPVPGPYTYLIWV